MSATGTALHELQALAAKYNLPCIDLDAFLEAFTPSQDVLSLIPVALSRRYRMVPLSVGGETLTLALDCPMNVAAVDVAHFASSRKVEVVCATPSAIERAIERLYAEDEVVVVVEKSAEAFESRCKALAEAALRSPKVVKRVPQRSNVQGAWIVDDVKSDWRSLCDEALRKREGK